MRTGIVLDRDTPAMNRLTGLVRWGLVGRIADGHQLVSWIHITDFLAVVRRALEDDSLSGVVHVTSPNPVRNAELMSALRRVCIGPLPCRRLLRSSTSAPASWAPILRLP